MREGVRERDTGGMMKIALWFEAVSISCVCPSCTAQVLTPATMVVGRFEEEEVVRAEPVRTKQRTRCNG